MLRRSTVSYTHLDVYKRQQQMEQPLATAIVDANLGQTYLELNRLDSAQKDVYKRQKDSCTPIGSVDC